MSNTVTSILTVDAPEHAPFRPRPLPLMGRLTKRAMTPYRRRWAKRLFKRPVRMTFDAAYALGFGGRIDIDVDFPEGPRTFNLDLRDMHHFNVWGHGGAVYEPEVAALLERLLTGDVRFADIGANWGWFSVYAATLPRFTGAIDAAEPMLGTHACLADAAAQLNLTERIRIHRLAFSDAEGEARMAAGAPMNSGVARIIGPGGPGGADAGAGENETVACAALDSGIIGAPDVIKMDIEGHEYQALRGGERLLRGHRPFIIMENWFLQRHAEDSLKPLRFLHEMGYALYRPMWMRPPPGAGANSVSALAAHPPEHGPRRLALAPFDWPARPVHPDQINVFACPKERAADLAGLGFEQAELSAAL